MNVGYGRREVADAIYAQATQLPYFHTYAGHSTEALIRLSARVVEHAGGSMERVFYGLSGSDANETQVKLVWYYQNARGKPEKKKIISRRRGYHGCSIFSGSLTGLDFYHGGFDLPVRPVLHTGAPHYYLDHEDGESEEDFSRRRARELEELIVREGPETVAAFIGEPVLGTGGIVPPPAGYWAAIQEVLRAYDVLLIADEVVTGFGRTGRMFGSHLYDIEPDLITIAKGLTSAYIPLSGVIVSSRVCEALETGADRFGSFSHGYTYTGHPVGAAAANAVLDIIEREQLVENAATVGAHLQDELRRTFAHHPFVGDIRGVGLLAAVELAADPVTRTPFPEEERIGARVAAEALERGLIVRALPHGDIIGFSPPLVISREDVDAAVAIVSEAVDAVTPAMESAAGRVATGSAGRS
jgi:L-2,4-diaminobutyrate transaminase